MKCYSPLDMITNKKIWSKDDKHDQQTKQGFNTRSRVTHAKNDGKIGKNYILIIDICLDKDKK